MKGYSLRVKSRNAVTGQLKLTQNHMPGNNLPGTNGVLAFRMQSDDELPEETTFSDFVRVAAARCSLATSRP